MGYFVGVAIDALREIKAEKEIFYEKIKWLEV